MRWDRILQVVLAFLVLAGFLALFYSNLFDADDEEPAGEKPEVRSRPFTAQPAVVQEKTPPPAEAETSHDIDPQVMERLERLNNAELRVLHDLPEAEAKLRLTRMQKEHIRALVHESMAEMNVAANDAAVRDNSVLFDEALKRVETDARVRLKKVLDPGQIEKLKRMAEDYRKQ